MRIPSVRWAGQFEGTVYPTDSPPLEYLAATAEGLIGTEYLYGSIWSLKEGCAPYRLPHEGRFVAIGGDGRSWAAVDPGNETVVLGTSNSCVVRKGSWARDARSVAAAGDDIWVARDNSLLKVTATGLVAQEIAVPGVTAMSCDSLSGLVALACTDNHRVVIIDPIDGHINQLKLELRFPRGVAFGPDGTLWVSDTEHRRILTADGTVVVDLGHRPGFPVGLAWHNDLLWAASPYERTVAPVKSLLGAVREETCCFYPYAAARVEGELWVSHPSSGLVRKQGDNSTVRDIADPIALANFEGLLAIAERDRGRILLRDPNGYMTSITLTEGSQPRSLTVSNDGELWIATQSPSALFAVSSRGARLVNTLSALGLCGLPRAIVWVGSALAITTDTTPAVVLIDPVRAKVLATYQMPEPPVSLAAVGETILAGLDRAGTIVAVADGITAPIATGLVTPRGIVADRDGIVVVESLAHRIRWGDFN